MQTPSTILAFQKLWPCAEIDLFEQIFLLLRAGFLWLSQTINCPFECLKFVEITSFRSLEYWGLFPRKRSDTLFALFGSKALSKLKQAELIQLSNVSLTSVLVICTPAIAFCFATPLSWRGYTLISGNLKEVASTACAIMSTPKWAERDTICTGYFDLHTSQETNTYGLWMK